VTQEPCRTETVSVDLRCKVTIQDAADISSAEYNIAFDLSVIYFLTSRTCVRNGLRDFSVSLYIRVDPVLLATLFGLFIRGF
jgi:hypothetical protein